MLNFDQIMEIKDKRKLGLGIAQIAKQTNHGKRVVKKVLAGEYTGRRKSAHPVRGSALDPYKPALRELFEMHGLSAERLHEHAQGMGYSGSKRTVRRFRQGLKAARIAASALTVRYETPPGRQAQCDWFEPGHFTWGDGHSEKVYGFEIVLGHSRLGFTAYTLDMALPTLLDCLARAFAFFGGVPEEILFDNMASVRLPQSREIHPMMADFAKHYGFTPKTHRVRRPRTKGKVERFGGYAQDNFLKGRTFDSLEHLNAENLHWLEKANTRLHSSTKRQPREHFEAEEREQLQPLAAPYTGLPVKRKVSAEATVHFEGSRYSVPPKLCRQEVFVKTTGGRIQVLVGDLVVADHAMATGKGQSVTKSEHLTELWKMSVGHTKGFPHPSWLTNETAAAEEKAAAGASVERVPISGPDVQIRPLADYETAFAPSKEAA